MKRPRIVKNWRSVIHIGRSTNTLIIIVRAREETERRKHTRTFLKAILLTEQSNIGHNDLLYCFCRRPILLPSASYIAFHTATRRKLLPIHHPKPANQLSPTEVPQQISLAYPRTICSLPSKDSTTDTVQPVTKKEVSQATIKRLGD